MSAPRFSIGRGAENDLPIANAALSRFHAKIERVGGIFVLTDNNSSNGTQLNGNDLTTSIALEDNDKITLGGAVNLKVEISESDFHDADGFDDKKFELEKNAAPNDDASRAVTATKSEPANLKPQSAPFEVASQSRGLIWLVPIGGVFVLLLAVIVILLLSGDGGDTKRARRENNANFEPLSHRTKNFDDPPVTNSVQNENENRGDAVSNQPAKSDAAVDANAVDNSNDAPPPTLENGEIDAVAVKAQKFLRNISRESNPILTQKQLAMINAKIKNLKSSAALRDNLRDAAKDAAQFQAIANANGLKPQFLSVFAVTKLGESRGAPLSAANAALPNLKKSSEVLGSELANDCLLIVAANAEGVEPNTMRDRLTSLAKQTPNVSAATVRSVWFLHEKGKIGDAAFDFILRFIAVGAISNG